MPSTNTTSSGIHHFAILPSMNFGMSDREIFQIDRRNPFAAGFDHVLRAVRDPHVSMLVDGRDVAGVEIAVLVENVGIDAEICLRYRGAADFQSAERLAV